MKNILHTNLPAVRHERARGDSCSLTPDQLTTNDTPTPAFHPTLMNTTITARLGRRALILSMYLMCWSVEDTFVWAVNRRAFSVRWIRPSDTNNYFDFYEKVVHMVNDFNVSSLIFFFIAFTNYKHLAAEQINHRVSWVITQIHAKSFTAKWWSGKRLTLLLFVTLG